MLEDSSPAQEDPTALVSRDPLPPAAHLDELCETPPSLAFLENVQALFDRARAAGLEDALDILVADRLEVEAFRRAASNFSFVRPLLQHLLAHVEGGCPDSQ